MFSRTAYLQPHHPQQRPRHSQRTRTSGPVDKLHLPFLYALFNSSLSYNFIEGLSTQLHLQSILDPCRSISSDVHFLTERSSEKLVITDSKSPRPDSPAAHPHSHTEPMVQPEPPTKHQGSLLSLLFQVIL